MGQIYAYGSEVNFDTGDDMFLLCCCRALRLSYFDDRLCFHTGVASLGPIHTKNARFFRRVLSVPEHSHLSRKTLDVA